jgi:hypothetical protein
MWAASGSTWPRPASSVAQVLHQQQAGPRIGAEQPGCDRHRHCIQVIQGGQFIAEKLRADWPLPALALEYRGAARRQVQPEDMPPVPERFCGLHLGWLAQCPGQQRLGRPPLIVRQRWWRVESAIGSFSPSGVTDGANSICQVQMR